MAFLGDGFLASFDTPAAGLGCAITIQQDLQRYGRDHADRRIRVRIGLHHGEAVERDGTLYGQAVNAASRVMSEAAGGQILVTAAVRDAVAATGAFSFVDRGLYWLRGFPDRWRLFEAEWGRDDAGGAVGPVQTPFVERERERADLRRAVEDARVGHGSLVLVSGEAGVGKTRLTQEVDAEADARGLRVLVGHSTRDEGRALIVGTFRDDEVEPSSPLARILNQLVRQRLVTRISLRPLTEEGVAALVAGLTGQRPPATLVSGIYAQSEGNPFFAEEVYLHLAEAGVLFDDQGRFRGDLRVEDLDVPTSIRMVIGERLARLSEATQRALVAAAVRGREFELDLVEQVAGEPGGDLLDAFDEAERARLIAPAKGGSSSYAFPTS